MFLEAVMKCKPIVEEGCDIIFSNWQGVWRKFDASKVEEWQLSLWMVYNRLGVFLHFPCKQSPSSKIANQSIFPVNFSMCI